MNKKLLFELLWIAISIVIAIIVLLPIIFNLGLDYPLYFHNIIIIFISITFIRYIFLLKHHYIALYKWIKVIFIFIPVVVFLYLMDVMYEFQSFNDEVGIQSFMSELSQKTQSSLGKYIRNEMIFFWSTAFITNALLPVRMVISLWREINKGTH